MGSSLRVHWMLAELDLAYETLPLDLRAKEQYQPAYLAINPAGQIPTLLVDDFILSESMVITRYLAARFKPELNGRTLEEQAKGAQWELWTMLNLQTHFSTLAMQKWTGVAQPEAEAKAREALPSKLVILEGQLAKHPFIVGDQFTTGDLNIAVGLSYAGFTEYDLSSYPNIQRWMNTVTTRPAYVAVLAKRTA